MLMPRAYTLPYSDLSAELQQLLPADHCCVLVYRMPGTSAEFSVRSNVLGLLRRGKVDFLCLEEGWELRLDWLVAVNGHRLAA
ncbi:hypothetical protein HMJ29_08365 [Hymenobacter taeanensis]|uniref:Uncharacterized protein n=1 Tax=Hymenobacter taeanensis TaxID=2735321 RepID=A0A6M6BIR1_9BACT|nr:MULTISPECIES: hypothetical protein [Hymenobacter]QJX46945.1 hypothetical protein HMJ29_08365 [Hymenobacter taeanensis]UOQ80822.1 hypothetical protein MUN83_18720 [Hymenobacter sp. 5414T-23]